jgi:hypothetical protein
MAESIVRLSRDSTNSSKPPSSDIVNLYESRLNVDEMGHNENGECLWTWCFNGRLYLLFKIEESRGSKVLMEVLGKGFNGVLGCDYFSA